jgi:hypothetical protein
VIFILPIILDGNSQVRFHEPMLKMVKWKRFVIWITAVVCVIIGCCFVWQICNSKIVGAVVEQKAAEILKTECSLELTNSWRTVNASGGLVGSPFYSVRWWREYFLLKKSDIATFEALSREFGRRRSRNDFSFLPSGYAGTILPHKNSAILASWWQPESNTEPMYMSATFSDGGSTVYIYGFKKATNALLYIHIIER